MPDHALTSPSLISHLSSLFTRSAGLRLYRAAVLVFVVALLQQQARWLDAQRPGPISLRVAQRFFPSAHQVQLRDPARGLHYVVDARGETLGCLLTTSPDADDIVGYSGPNNVLVALDARGAFLHAELLRSGDTVEHVEKVRAAREFWQTWRGWKPADTPAPPAHAVGGATLTSLAIAEAVQHRLAGAAPSLRFPEPIALSEIQTLFTNAVRFAPDRSRWQVFDGADRALGFVLRTSPQADNVGGYRGPSECLVAVAPDGRTLLDLRVRRSFDTDSYVDQIRTDQTFLRSFVGRTVHDLAALDFSRARVEGVSGATQTSFALAEGLKRRAAAEVRALSPPASWRPAGRDWGLAGLVAGAMLMAFTPLRGSRWLRGIWQLTLVGYLGLVSHDLLSLSLLHGWALHGPPLRAASGLVVLGGAALVVPWATRRQLYCHQLCPHGAAQQWLGRLGQRLGRPWNIPARWSRRLEAVPALLLTLALAALLSGVPLNLAALEPFDAWTWRTAGVASIALAISGLIASLFVPQAYCRFGCPTGALLNFIRSAGSADRWGRRDAAALVLLALGVATTITVRLWPTTPTVPAPTSWSGRAMGMSWTVKTFDEVANPAEIGHTLSNELAWVESMISHWRPETDLAQFNASRETNALPVPWPVVTLSRWAAEVGRETGGALDITVGPLVRLWGFGPTPRRTNAPAVAEIETTRQGVGWEKLAIMDGQLRKRDPRVEVDLSSVAEGWALDHLTRVLQRRGLTNLLVALGGELRASGRWTVAIEHPNRTCVLQDEALGTSGTYRERRDVPLSADAPPGPSRTRTPSPSRTAISHLIDPRTGHPVAHRTVSVSVRHPEASRADLWATALNVLGVDEGFPMAERLKLAAQFVIEAPDGTLTVRPTASWRELETARMLRAR